MPGATKDSAEKQLGYLREKWNERYPIMIKSWQNKWENISTYFAYTSEIRKLIYTTNSVEALHRQFRKVPKSKRFSRIACPDLQAVAEG